MSKENREAAQKALTYDRDLGVGPRLLLVTIADLVDERMELMVPASKLAYMVGGVTRQAVRNWLCELEVGGYLRALGPKVRGRKVHYRLVLDFDLEWKPNDPRAGSSSPKVTTRLVTSPRVPSPKDASLVVTGASLVVTHKNRKNQEKKKKAMVKNQEKRKTRQSRETVSQSIAKEKNHTLAAAEIGRSPGPCPMCGFLTSEDEFHGFCRPIVCACGERMAEGENRLSWWDSPHYEHGDHELIASPEPEVIAEIRDREWSRRYREKNQARDPICCTCGEKAHTPSCGVVLGTEKECWEHADVDAPF